MSEYIKDLKDDPVDFITKVSTSTLAKVLKYAADKYYNDGKSVIGDDLYDMVREAVEEANPKHPVLKKIGAPVRHAQNKAKLPYFMGSMNKIKPGTGALDKWLKKYEGPYVYSDKLDGVSGLYVVGAKGPEMYTRGNGKVGTDISGKIPLFPSLNLKKSVSSMKKGLAVRGEFIMKKKTFKDKYQSTTKNARNMVAGVINSKTVDQRKAADVDFVAYEIINPKMAPSEQYKTLKK